DVSQQSDELGSAGLGCFPGRGVSFRAMAQSPLHSTYRSAQLQLPAYSSLSSASSLDNSACPNPDNSVSENMGSEDLDDAVEKIMNGEGLEVTCFDMQPEQLEPVTLRKTVCYIVSAVIFNAKEEVLMVQEAKRECYGDWYLPAGRMEKGESIQEAVQREVKEEAGVDCQPVTLLLVEEHGPRWIRFTFLAEITASIICLALELQTLNMSRLIDNVYHYCDFVHVWLPFTSPTFLPPSGGNLKTTAEADSESLQAQWWDRQAPLPLRCRDILALIDAGLKYRQKPWFPVCQPVDLPCEVVCQRLLLAFPITNPKNSDEEHLWLLLGNGTVDTNAEMRPHLPVVVATKVVMWAGRKVVQRCMASSHHALNLKFCGILGLQHNGRVHGKTDGICFNTLLMLEYSEEGPVDPCSPPPLDSESYRWHEVTNQSLRTNILQRMREASLIPVRSW
ncbi:hypothetical protein NFI96_005458, partial [Prochilodus magdalenae]